MKRSELEDRLRELYVAHQAGSSGLFLHRDCDWCASRMARVMGAVDEYIAALSSGPSATRYRQGSIIRQAVPHGEFPQGVRRWRVWAVEEDDYLVQALFSDGAPMVSRWFVPWCEAVTELEWQDDETGRIDPEGRSTLWPPFSRKARDDNALQAGDRGEGPVVPRPPGEGVAGGGA